MFACARGDGLALGGGGHVAHLCQTALLGAVTCHVEAPVEMHDAVCRSAGTRVSQKLRCVFDDMNFMFCLFLHLHSCTNCCMVSAGTVFTGFRKENLGD